MMISLGRSREQVDRAEALRADSVRVVALPMGHSETVFTITFKGEAGRFAVQLSADQVGQMVADISDGIGLTRSS